MNMRTKSPIKFLPPRAPGQSLDEEIQRKDEIGLIWSLAIGMCVALTAYEWWRWYANPPPSPIGVSLLGLVVSGIAAYKLKRIFERRRALVLGRDGERSVAHYLERFRTKGFFVFHDVPQTDANIDHVLIGTRGLYTIETKTLSKPVRGECRITISKEWVFVNGRKLDRDPVKQAKAQAKWLHELLAESEFKQFVRPVVAFPGWFVEPHDRQALGVWVLEPKALDSFIESEPEVLSHDQVRAMASVLSNYIRSKSTL